MFTLPTETSAIFLNSWANREGPALGDFIQAHRDSMDFFFFTEVTHIHRSRIRNDGAITAKVSEDEKEKPLHLNSQNVLNEYLGKEFITHYEHSTREIFQCLETGIKFENVGFGSMMAIKNDVEVIALGPVKICKNPKSHNTKRDRGDISERVLQWVVYQKGDVRYLMAHLHGVWIRGMTKEDHPVRMQQSREVLAKINSLVKKHNVSKVVFGGDLNLNPDTEALALLLSENHPWSLRRNLISEYEIKSTRSPLYRHPHGSQFADYLLCGNNVEVTHFQVGEGISVSDHEPLIVTFS